MALELVENGNTGYVSRQKINAGLDKADDSVSKFGDTMIGVLIAPKVKVLDIPEHPEDVISKEYFDEYNRLNGGSTTFVGETAPLTAAVNSSWYCTANGLTYILLDDGDSIQWVEANPNYPTTSSDHNHDTYVLKAGDTMTGPLITTNSVMAKGGTQTIKMAIDGYGKPCIMAGNPNSSSQNWLKISGEGGDPLSELRFIMATNVTPILDWPNADYKFYHEGFKPAASEIGAVPITGGTMTGNLSAPMVSVTGTPTNPTDVATKAYVDGSSGSAFVLKTGDTMTGGLTINKSSGQGLVVLKSDEDVPLYVFGNKGGVDSWLIGNMNTSDDVYLNSYRHANHVKLASDHTLLQKDPRSGGEQGTNPASLTRKDYVDLGLTTANEKLDVFKSEIYQYTSELMARITALEAEVAALKEVPNGD